MNLGVHALQVAQMFVQTVGTSVEYQEIVPGGLLFQGTGQPQLEWHVEADR